MRSLLALVLPLAFAAQSAAQSCTGLCLQQVSCPNGGTTSISGVVYAPNGTDPLPGVIVYVPNAAVAPFTPGVSCAVAGEPPSGSPLVGTTTGVDGSFTLANVPVGSNIPLVIQSGRWRRQVVVPSTAACAATSFSTRFAQTQSEGDIPKFAVVTGSADAVECVLRKVGIADSEFTDASGNGRINIFAGTGSAGAIINKTTPTGDDLMGNQTTLNGYDVLMLPCEGAPYLKNTGELGNLVQFANSGGRVYASHYSYVWMYQNPPFDTVVNWAPNQPDPPNGTATVNTSFAQGQTLSQWLGVVGASTSAGQIPIETLRHDLNGVVAPTQSWLTLNNPSYGNPVMQFTFDTPVGATTGSCGRVLFNEYHVEEPGLGDDTDATFPTECVGGAMTAQEKLLEFSLFDLTGNGTPPTLSPTTNNFGNQAVGSSTPVQKFLWTNNTLFPVSVTSATTAGDFNVTANNCSSVGVGATCEIDVVFTPTTLGTRTGTLTVAANTGTLTASLSGTGISPLAISATSLDFGNVDVGATATQKLTVTNQTGVAQALATPAASGSFTITSGCGSSLAAQSSCTITVAFSPTSTGPQTGSVSYSLAGAAGATAPVVSSALTGNGIDFSEIIGPTSGQVVAGLSASTTSTTTPIAGFNNALTVTCTTTAPASTCTLGSTGFTPSSATKDAVSITTTSQYAVVGLGGFGRSWSFAVFAAATGLLLLRTRRRSGLLRLAAVALCALSVGSLLTGCSGKQPAQNNPYTPAGTYSYTVTASDGFLKHSATYSLVVTAK